MQVSRKAVGLVLVGLSVVALAIGGYYALPGRAEESPAAPVKAKTAPATAAVPAALLKPVAGKNFVIVPFTSELQQNRCKSYRTATFFVLINGAAMINADDTVLDVGAVDFKGLHDALLTFVQAHFPRRIIIYANVGTRHLTCGRGTASWFLLCQLHNLAPTGIPQTGLVWGEIDWKSVAADLATPATAEANQRESGIGDDLVRAYPICTPLSRYFFTTHADCVILNLKPLDQLTPKELEAFPARAKVYAEKLKLKQPIRANFNVNHGTSTVKANRARRKLRFGGAPGDRKWWRAQGFDLKGEGLWDSTSWTCPALYLKVTDEEGSPVKDVRITVDLPPEIKEAPGSLKFTQQSDGRWRSGHLPRDDEFTLIVDAPGYQPNRQKFTLPAGAKKDVEVKLKPAASKTTEPAAKTSAATPPQEKKAIRALTYTGRVTDKLTGKPIAGAAVTVRREILAPYELRLLEEPKYTTDASGRYTFTIPPEQVAERFLYIELDVSHPDYATRRGFGYALSMIRKNEPLGMRPFFEHVELYPADPIAGTVVTADGKPAAAVKVLGFSMPNRGDFESASFSDATTDPKGAFRLNLTKGSKAIFWILPKDDAPSAHLVDEKRGDLGRFTLEKGTALKGRVRDEHGKPVAGVWVNAEITGGPAKKMSGLPVADFLARAALTDAQGKFTLAPLPAGECVVRVADYPHDGLLRNQGHRPSPGVFGPQRLTLKADEATVLVGLRAVPQVVIEGQFYDSRGKTRLGHAPMLWGHLDLESSEGQSWMDLLFKPSGDAKQKNRNDPRSFYSAYGAMDKKGHFVIRAPKGLKDAKLNLMTNEHGALRVRMTKDGPLSNQHRDIDLGTLQHDVQGIEFVRYDAPILLVKPVAEKGGPLRDVKVNLEYAEGKGPWKGGGRFTEGKDVHFEKQNDGRWRSEQLLPDEEFTVTVDAAGYEPKSEKLKLPEGAVKDVEVRLKKKT